MRKKKTATPVTTDEALEIAKKKFPEKYEEFDFGGRWGKQLIDLNSIKRVRFANSLLHRG